jgi:predicted AAA+ superfamily ATPase
MYYKRELETIIRRAITQFPAVLVTGPRQAGKSTFLRHALSEYRYTTLDDPGTRTLAIRDPELFLSQHPTPLIIDEIQYAPDLLIYLKIKIDADRSNYGRYVLTGSQMLQLMEGVTETLAGRIAIFQLYPLHWKEISAIPGYESAAKDDRATFKQMVRGFYPELFHPSAPDWSDWFSSYIASYLDRDVRDMRTISDLSRFQTFLALLATRAGQLLNLSEISKECGVSHPTVKDWLSILQATYVVHLLKPYFKNHSKRLVKSPKLYFVDTGLLCYLLGIDSAERLLNYPQKGAIFENMVVMEKIKQMSSRAERRELYFYRTSSGLEVDLLMERAGELEAYEIKCAKTITAQMAGPLNQFLKIHPEAKAYLLSLREEALPLNRQVQALHWSEL